MEGDSKTEEESLEESQTEEQLIEESKTDEELMEELEELKARIDQVRDASLESTERILDMVEASKSAGIDVIDILTSQGKQFESVENCEDQIDDNMADLEEHLELPRRSPDTKKRPGRLRRFFKWFFRPCSKKRNREPETFDETFGEFTDDTVTEGSSSPTTSIDDPKEALIEENITRTSEGLRDLRDIALDISEVTDSESPMLEEIHYKADLMANRLRNVTDRLDEC